jgi:hypothetical protein
MNESTSNSEHLPGAASIKRHWANFNRWFWIFFFLKVSSAFIGSALIDQAGLDPTAVFFLIIQSSAVLAMVFLLGFYAQKLSRNKSFWLFGLLGLFWVGTIGIFIGYFAIRGIRDKEQQRIDSSTLSFMGVVKTVFPTKAIRIFILAALLLFLGLSVVGLLD